MYEGHRKCDGSKTFPGLTTQLNKLFELLRDLLNTKNSWVWLQSQDDVFQRINDLISSDCVLALYDCTCDANVSADT